MPGILHSTELPLARNGIESWTGAQYHVAIGCVTVRNRAWSIIVPAARKHMEYTHAIRRSEEWSAPFFEARWLGKTPRRASFG